MQLQETMQKKLENYKKSNPRRNIEGFYLILMLTFIYKLIYKSSYQKN